MSNLEDFVPLLQRIPTPKSLKAKRIHHKLATSYQALIDDHKNQISNREMGLDYLAEELTRTKETDDTLDQLDKIMLLAGFMIGGTSTVNTLFYN
jgi:hypothetical protein